VNRSTIIKWVLVIAATFASGWLLAMAVVVFALSRYDFTPIPFDSETWINSPSEHSHESVRLRMVDDLLLKHPLVDKNRVEVEDLLGPADTGYFSNRYDMVYHLGLERQGIAIDSEWLIIDLDDQDEVVDIRLHTD